jgi:lambda family phage portal protein
MRRRSVDLGSKTLSTAYEELRNDYNAAKSSRYRRNRTGVGPIGRTADYHYRSEGDYLRILELSRDFVRNDPIVGQGLRRLVHNVLRDGFKADPQTESTELNAYLSGKWRAWSEDPERCDIAREHNFHALEKFVLEQTIADGDIIPLLTREGAIQLVEAHRCRTPSSTKRNVIHGVLLDDNRVRQEYWLTKEDVDPMRAVKLVSEVTPYPTRNADGHRVVLHCYRPDRVSQTRGISACAPMADLIGMHDDIQFAQLVKQQVASCFAFIRERDLQFSLPGADQPLGSQSSETLSDGTTRTIEGIAPGMQITGMPGERFTTFSPNIPNPEFFPHAMMILTFIAINLNLPVAVLLLDPTKTNFSGWRGAIDQARMSFQDMQQWLIGCFHTPVYRWKVRQWLEGGDAELRRAVAAGVDIFRHRWTPPAWGYIEPLKDASADLLRVRNALISHRRRCAERGIDWDDLSSEIVEDNATLIRKAFDLATQLNQTMPGLNVTWRELAHLPTPDGVQITIPDAGAAGEPTEGNDAEK